MKRSAAFIPELHEASLNMEVETLQMLLRGGFIRKIGDGIYCILPLGKRIISKLENEIANQLKQFGALELSFPIIQSEKLNELKDSITTENSPFSLPLSNLFTMYSLIQEQVDANLTMPLIFFQIDRLSSIEDFNGAIRTKEYIMNEVYTFCDNEECFHQTNENLLNIYKNLLSKLGLHYRITSGVPMLNHSENEEEMFILSELGDETIVYSDQSNYSANIKVAQVGNVQEEQMEMKPIKKIALENIKELQDVLEKRSVSIKDCIKSVLYIVDDTYYVVLTRGDHEVNETKLQKVLNAKSVQLADSKQLKKVLNCSKGYIGPIKLPLEVKVIADTTVKNMYNAIAGSNEEGFYYENVNPQRDFAINQYDDIRLAMEGDLDPNNEGTIHLQKGFKVGHIIKLNLTEKLQKPIYAGCYYFGITQLFAILAERFHDSSGFIWPKEIAPYQISLVVKNVHDHTQKNLADEIYNILSFYRFEVLYDDRDEKPEKKYVDSDLIGLPILITIGEKASDGLIDVKIRSNNQTHQFVKEELIDWLTEYFRVE